MFITSVDGMPRPSPLLSCRPNVHFFIVEAVESRYGQRAAYTDETRKFLFAHTPPQKRSAADGLRFGLRLARARLVLPPPPLPPYVRC